MRLSIDHRIKLPGFPPNITVQVQGNQVLISSSEHYVVLEGEMSCELVQALASGESMDDIIDVLGSKYPSAELYYLVMRLYEDGYLVDKNEQHLVSHAGFWSEMGYSPVSVHKSLEENSLGIVELGFDQPLLVQEMLADLDVQINPHSRRKLVMVDSYMHPQLARLNKEAHRLGHQLLLARPSGTELWIGPIIQPGKSSCWECIRHRLELNRPNQVFQVEIGSTITHSKTEPVFVKQMALGMIALETAKWLASPDQTLLHDALISFDLRSLKSQSHRVVKRPQCEVCGSSQIEEKRTKYLSLISANATRGSNFRVCSIQTTLDQYEHHVSPITGVVRSLARVNSEGECTHNYTAGHSGRHKGHSIESLRLATRDQSGGKGISDSFAKASGLCEALERYSAVYDNDPIDLKSPYSALGEAAIHPNSLLLFSDKQFEERDTWNEQQSGHFQLIPEPFDETKEIAWSRVWSLTNNQFYFIPTSYCYYGFDGLGNQYCRADSNGLASGNTLEEAILYGFLELAERDAVSIWWYNRIKYPEVDFLSFNDSYFHSIQAFYHSLNRKIWVLDITHDLEIPTFVAVSSRISEESEDILMGFGAHFDAKTAITRAILEVNQSLPAVLKSDAERKSQLLPDFKDVLDWWESATIKNERYLTSDDYLNRTSILDYQMYESVDLNGLIESYVEKLSDLGLQMLVLDLTRPDIGLPVARIIVPGLRHFWRRLAPGRLYQVPAKLGRMNSALTEGELNPISLFL